MWISRRLSIMTTPPQTSTSQRKNVYRDHSGYSPASCPPLRIPLNEEPFEPESMAHTRLNDASTLQIGFMHMLSIVHMLYLSSKSLSVHTHRDEGYVKWLEDVPNGSVGYCL